MKKIRMTLMRASVPFLVILGAMQTVRAQFVHPGGLHTLADLERMKTNVLAGNHPWIDDWNVLLNDSQAKTNYATHVRANMGASRQNADLDAHAAYLNAIRWYISGDANYANKATNILNSWSAAVNQVPSGTDIPGLIGIPIFDFALAGEVLRIYPGWKASDFSAFTNMMTVYLYPSCHGFLSNHNGACIGNYWANWDACNIGALMAMGVLCDNPNFFNEGVNYFKTGAGNGSISNAVPFLYNDGSLGQWQESGRDQEHAQLGVGLLGSACQVAWNQGLDLFGFANNRLLVGAEYVAQCNLSHPISSIPYTFYNNCSDARQCYLSINGLGNLRDRPVWELLYNHYVVLQGLSATNCRAMAQLMRPEHGSIDHFGYGTLAFTLNTAASTYPPSPAPPAPTGLIATPGVSQVFLKWNPSVGDTAQGFVVRRSTTSGGPYTTVASWNASTLPQYIDVTAANGKTYYYVVAATNQSGTSANSAEASAKPEAAGALPVAWRDQDIGSLGLTGSATYASVNGNTFIVKGAGRSIGGPSDSCNFVYGNVTGDFSIVGRLANAKWAGNGRVGLMMRESLEPSAKTVTVTLGQIGHRECYFGARSSTGGAMRFQPGNDYTWLPVWFKLQRSGNIFTSSQSLDGTNWFAVGSSTVVMPHTYLVGMVVCSAAQSALSTTTFDNVTTNGVTAFAVRADSPK
ncbi:MAG TPA: alginate lyase family protein [Verrucomicrobiae bacterium]|nr:alginate lyase family protein [Verrucomicrobiae bacterium]